MDKNKKKRKSTPPSSLHHYTSLGTVAALFDNAINQQNDNPRVFAFRASNALCMNDKMEGMLIVDKFLTDSEIKKQYQNQLEKIVKDKGEIYSISFCASNQENMNSGNIPMWDMYGDGGAGAILSFDYKKLEQHASSNSMLLSQCKYWKTNEVQSYITDVNKDIRQMNEEERYAALSDFRKEAFIVKDWHWRYEDEWRILFKSKEEKYITNKYGIASYTEVGIPINCLNAIILGPLVDFDMCEKVLNIAISRLKEADSTISQDIKIKPSKLQMR